MRFEYKTNNPWIMLVAIVIWAGITASLMYYSFNTNWRVAIAMALAMWLFNWISYKGRRPLG